MTYLIKLGALWGKRDRLGNEMLSCRISPTAIIYIFKNTFKEKENDPDFLLYLGKANGNANNNEEE